MLQIFPVQDLRRISARLHGEFNALSRRCVERCVSDTWHCVEHLGITVTPHLVERVAREHLEAMVNSVPPSQTVRKASRRPGTSLFTSHHTVSGPR
ncbi:MULTISPECIES: hypothetical protein [Nocardiopsis]|uniref:Uncharacterized protein n=1 Tax=Nocardiopsis sinuspersici TaxID=501010 RepID=A0A1V3C356_9ACTN|nr:MULTISPECIES: hypothetical protein [Nocardiopsis]NYH51175.1 hypothetical protein [Nocardiopsis sinuspersici]OOC54946.1 hypothetical protein NOSIN_15005 [Nocardiopsis sinuspersici]